MTILIGYWALKWFLERLKVEHYGGKYVLVTGCDSGFGHLLAKRLDGLGLHVIAACLKQDAAAELKKSSGEVYHQDIKVSILEPETFKTNIINPTMINDIYQRAFKHGDVDCQQFYGENFFKDCINDLIRDSSVHGNINMVIDAYEHAITARYPKCRYICGNKEKYFLRFLWTIPEWIYIDISVSNQ
ncbi:retinol dehydrogenase 7-like [Patella vulgata]|uniref:retinol dehydrogenase 7-like n=1 Tax=Patella vulgata TaxID=6465 RepID=UPI0024A98BA9|nr:retinol dehydrogenase 7-like [Patella vulgata]